MTTQLEIDLTLHEKFDGSGYPHGLVGTDIPMSGRIAALADVFDALTSERPYQKAWTVEAAMDLARENRGARGSEKLHGAHCLLGNGDLAT